MMMRNARSGRLPRLAGFTLVELMVVVVITAILLAIAVPTYQMEMRKSRRTEARNTVLDAAAREERYYATQNAYTSDTGQLQYTAGSGGFPFVSGTYYQIQNISTGGWGQQPGASSTGVTLGGFTVQVTPAPNSLQQADTPCQSFYVDQTGRTWSTDSGGNDTTSTCWP